MGGLLTLGSFEKVFPEIATSPAAIDGLPDAEVSQRSTVQGIFSSFSNQRSVRACG